jgi:hypothetical protein
MIYFVNFGWIGEDAGRPICHNGVRLPGIPELVADSHVLLEPLVTAASVRHGVAIGVPLALRIRGHDIPSNPPGGEVVEAR